MERKRKPVELLRVPFNCNLAPATKELITGIQNKTRESQGEVVDRAVALLVLGEEVQPRTAKKASKRDKAIQERAASDVVAQLAERENIDYSDVESTPTTNVAMLTGTVKPQAKASLDKWRASRKPLLKPKDR
jgi:hypothetical protein